MNEEDLLKQELQERERKVQWWRKHPILLYIRLKIKEKWGLPPDEL